LLGGVGGYAYLLIERPKRIIDLIL
jgi:hypothetical protein